MAEQEKPRPQPEVVPPHVVKRLEVFKSLEDKTPKPEAKKITVTLLPLNSTSENVDGEAIEATAGVTTPLEIMNAKCKDCGAFTCQINGKMWDLTRPIVEDCKITFITFDDERGKEVFWHSSAHVLGACIEQELGVEIAIGPATENGFFYDFEPHQEKIDPECLGRIQKRCIQMSKKKADYERKMITREDALVLFESNKYKQEILTNRVEPNSLVAVYRTGNFIDLCRGPHIINASIIKSWYVMDVSGSIWNGHADQKMNRIRAISFPSEALMKEYKNFLQEAAKRDHRKLGIDHNLFFFHPWSPGCAFWYPDGAYVYHRLMKMIREQYKKRGYVEVITPNLYYEDLFKTSGHWEHYQEDMFHFPIDDEPVTVDPTEKTGGCPCQCGGEAHRREMGLKPMNCPGHCLVFRSKTRSFREMPIRMAEFGVIHRNEATGALSGLTRVRRFVQDDAHIFARVDQIQTEISDVLDFMKEVYDYFGMTLEFTLSTINMEKYMGDLKVWETATNMLRQSLIDGKHEFKEMPGEAAFYGPKIDCLVKDCLGRKHQLATVQLDFQLPEKFNLEYVDSQNKPQRPVMIHRAVLGSLERFMGIAVEHFAARFPFWLSPHQIVLIPQNESKPEHVEHCQKLWKIFHDEDFTCTIDTSSAKLLKKIAVARKNTLAHAILVVGDREIADGTVSVRWWNMPEKAKIEPMPLEKFLEQIREMVANYK
ncbi:threonyl-tRNA synthetase [Histomonas meleagridis]|uniref:threonyl-tRNA synthetase n=1 Tax=Histomonas meleagridis TaxID=135588 RepID=UPI00355A89FD|nr:threonyl-tRNA synthetase [Histomonas meleagridis]KAH0806331.1 threonyl-tRNA synthetase [Histomonas meleagridis]